MDQTGLAESAAKAIEASYHKLYVQSDNWVAEKIERATQDGYVTVAFGLRVRTPMLSKVLWNSGKVPYEAKKEGRTAGNALGQSWGLLNNRAAIEFQEKTLASEFKYRIQPVAHIHDASYYIVDDDVHLIEWVNNNLIEAMQWQKLPEIYHPDVPLGGELGIFYPSWANEVVLPNNASRKEILNICDQSIT